MWMYTINGPWFETYGDQTKENTNSCSTNNKSPDEEIITPLVGQLDDFDLNKAIEAIDDSALEGSIGSPIHIYYENDTNTNLSGVEEAVVMFMV